MQEPERLNILLTHWIEHNESHIKSYRKWAEKFQDSKLNGIALKIEEAAGIISMANEKIKQAKDMLPGGKDV